MNMTKNERKRKMMNEQKTNKKIKYIVNEA